MNKKTIVVIGAGQGLGNHVAKRFGQENFRVVLMARNEKSLEQYEQEFEAEGIEVYSYVVDGAQPETLTQAFYWVKSKFDTPDVLIYNVGITSEDKSGQVDNAELMNHYQVDVASAYHCVQQIATEEFGKKNGTIIFTGGGLAMYPLSSFIPLSLDKAALRSLAYILHNELKSKGIFVGTVTISGAIGADRFFAPSQIAEVYWKMYQEREVCEEVYEYPELKDAACTGEEYWTKVYELTEKYK